MSGGGDCSVEIARQHQLKSQFVGPGSHAKPHASFNTQDLAGAIHDRPDFVELFVSGEEVVQGPAIGIFLDGAGPFVIYVVSDSRGGTNSRFLNPPV